MSFRTDPEGFATKVTALANGYGIRLLRHEKVIDQQHAKNKLNIAPVLREMLRMLDKCGNPSSMASASRVRNYCRPAFKKGL